ncbi:MAG: hypothetical protein ACK4OE_08925 [Acidovorax sp.]|uniref:phage fiber-tail adaptor protein n=1 Tax=Acidovorax sp. TaxID=1872122 RepID=UPI0039187BD1
MATEKYTGGPDKPTIDKDPDALLDYSFDLGPWLQHVGDTIESATFILDAPLVEEQVTVASPTAVVWISGGTPGQTHRVTCRFVTTGGRRDDRSIFLKIKQR